MKYEPSMWLKSYDQGVPPQIDPVTGSLASRFKEVVGKFGGKTAFHFMGSSMTYNQLDSAARSFAACLREHGIGKGDLVGVNLPNTPQYLIATLGALINGSAVTGVSPLLMPKEIVHQINDSGAKALVTLDALFAERVKGVAGEMPGLKLILATSIADYLPGLKKNAWPKLLKKVPSGKVEPVPGKAVMDFRKALQKPSGPKCRFASGHLRPGVHPVHRRHHGPAQGRRADPRQPAEQPDPVRPLVQGADGHWPLSVRLSDVPHRGPDRGLQRPDVRRHPVPGARSAQRCIHRRAECAISSRPSWPTCLRCG